MKSTFTFILCALAIAGPLNATTTEMKASALYHQHGKPAIAMDIVTQHPDGAVDLAYPGGTEVVVLRCEIADTPIIGSATLTQSTAQLNALGAKADKLRGSVLKASATAQKLADAAEAAKGKPNEAAAAEAAEKARAAAQSATEAADAADVELNTALEAPPAG